MRYVNLVATALGYLMIANLTGFATVWAIHRVVRWSDRRRQRRADEAEAASTQRLRAHLAEKRTSR